jgi:O-antigen ligase
VAGYGLGVTYDRYYMIPGHLIPTSYIHNGYLSGWFKTGILGLSAMLMITLLTLGTIRRRIHLGVESDTTLEKSMRLTIFGVMVTMLLVNLTSPVYYSFDGWLLLTLFAAYASRLEGDAIPTDRPA